MPSDVGGLSSVTSEWDSLAIRPYFMVVSVVSV
jgi:hypothetical protein